MSFGFSIGDFIAVLQLANKVRKRFVDSPEQFKAVSDEVKGLSNVLRDLEDVLPERDLTPQQQQNCQDHIRGCNNVLQDLDKIIDKYQSLEASPAGSRNKLRRFWKRLKFEPEDVRELRLRLISNIGLWNSFTGTLSLGLSQSTNDGVVRLNEHQNKEHLHRVAEWLSTSDYPAQQNDLINKRQEGTGQWLLGSKEFQAWLDGTESTLFCPGIPGAGKTIVTSIIIKDLQQRFRGDKKVGIAYVYCNYKRQTEQTVQHLMASLLKQLIQPQQELPEYVSNLYSQHKDRQTRPSVDELCSAIRFIAHGLARVFVVVDALDECTNISKTRSMFLKEMTNLLVQPNICLFATSRFIPDITAEFRGVPSLEIRATDGDVRAYLDNGMSKMPACVSRNPALQEIIRAEIVKSAGGMFLLAQLHLAGLSDKVTAKQVKVALQDLPKGSGALAIAYAEALERIKGQKSGFRRLAVAVLSWIICAKRQLTILELRHALAVEENTSEIAEDNFPEADEMVSVCAGMVTIDEESGVVRLVHLTMQEYFERTLQAWAPDAKAEIARACLTYLSFDAFKPGPCPSRESLRDRVRSSALFDYAARYWGIHVEGTAEADIEQMALEFLENEKNVASNCQIVMAPYEQPIQFYGLKYSGGTNAIHLIAYLGFARLVLVLLKQEHCVNLKDSEGQTPLHYAAKHEHEAIVRILLNQSSVDVNCKDSEGQTPLHYVARNGHETIVQILLNQSSVDANCKDNGGRTPLHHAANNGHEAIVKILLNQSSVDVNCKSKGETPLHYAVKHEHKAIVRILLNQLSVDVNYKDYGGKAPLHYAVKYKHEAIVRILLNQLSVDVNYKDYGGQAPLHYAVKYEHKAIVRILLNQSSVDVNCKDSKGQAPLHYAVKHEHEAIVRILLNQSSVDVNCKDAKGRTPLSYTAERGRKEIVRTLLDQPDVNVDCRDNRERTPLSYAAAFGREAIVQILLDQPDVNVDCRDNRERTPLSYAAAFKHEAIVQILLDQPDVNADSKDIKGRTPLSYAAEKGPEEIVRILLDQPSVNADSKDAKGQTPLSHAAEWGREEIVRILLDQSDVVDADCKDVEGRTPLSRAVECGSEEIIRILLNQPHVDVNYKDAKERTPLLYATQCGFKEIIRILLDQPDININCKDAEGRTSLSYAAERGREEIVRILLNQPGVVDADCKDAKGRTPLSYAAEYGREEIVRILLNQPGVVDADCKDAKGRTPLSYAAEMGREEIVQILLDQLGVVDADYKDTKGRTPLSYASFYGHADVAKLLMKRKDGQ